MSSDFKNNSKLTGMAGYTVIWIGQLLSFLGSGMTRFALMIWLWKVGGKATPFAIYGFSIAVAQIIASPLAGVFVDRLNRKLTMAFSDLAAGITSIAILILHITGALQIWHLYFLGAFAGFFGAFQFPAFSAAITTMVSKENYARASGMGSITGTVSGILAPLLGATFLELFGLRTILVIDIITFTIAISTLLFVYIPNPKSTDEGLKSVGSIWQESMYGFKYIFQRKSLLGLLLAFLSVNLVFSFSNVLRTPMILSITGNNELILGGVNSVTTVGGFVAGLTLMVWNGPKKKIRGIFTAIFVIGIGTIAMGVGKSAIVWSVSSLIMMFSAIQANAFSQAFWQSKVEPDIQGKVFAVRSMMSDLASPLAMLIAGPLADLVFEPMTASGTFTWLVGYGPGSGIALIFVITGIMAIVTAVCGYMFQSVRNAEELLPDNNTCAEIGVS